jgi:hypothetical protein
MTNKNHKGIFTDDFEAVRVMHNISVTTTTAAIATARFL